jgi:hypothetical protein
MNRPYQFHCSIRVVVVASQPVVMAGTAALTFVKPGKMVTISPHRSVTRPELVESASFVTLPPNRNQSSSSHNVELTM